jgi:hypothetical protein
MMSNKSIKMLAVIHFYKVKIAFALQYLFPTLKRRFMEHTAHNEARKRDAN